MKSVRSRSSALLLLALGLAAAAAAEPWGAAPLPADKVFGALEDEMARSLRRLKQDSFGPPYFLAYRLHDSRHYEVSASLGALVGEDLEEFRVAYAEARYGDAKLDNTDLSYQGVNAPASADPEVLRQTYWLLTDQAYKGAVSGWLEKKARRSTELVVDELDDLAPEPPQRRVEAVPGPRLDRARLRAIASRLSAVFRGRSGIFESGVTLGAWWSRRFLVNSEGARLLTRGEEMPHELRVSVATRAEDGMRLEDGYNLVLRSWSDLPAEAELERRARALADEVEALRAAPVQDAETAPAILDPEMSGVLFHEALGHKLEGQR
ncbi:MAG: hypothetical protein HY079_08085, partial [Elusimicrobia bacterium]|nr:hypothetical protein [Elusimicrobiota bacterium]